MNSYTRHALEGIAYPVLALAFTLFAGCLANLPTSTLQPWQALAIVVLNAALLAAAKFLRGTPAVGPPVPPAA